MTESKNIYSLESSNNQKSDKIQKTLQTKQNWSEEQILLNRSRCSYAKFSG